MSRGGGDMRVCALVSILWLVFIHECMMRVGRFTSVCVHGVSELCQRKYICIYIYTCILCKVM